MTDSLKFGPEWLRNMSADVTSAATTTLNNNNSSGMRYPLAEFRYGREEMLSLFDKTNVRVPDILPNFKKLFIDKVQCPLALTPSTEDDMRLWTRPVGITSGSGGGGGSGSGISTRGSRGGSVDRGRGRGRGTFHPSITHQRSTSLFDDDSRGVSTVRSSERAWPERNGGGTPINNNALVNEIVDWSSSSGGGGIGGSISSPRKEFSSHSRLTTNDNWRRTRLEDDMMVTDGWRSASSTSLTRQTSEKWGRSTSWRDEESSQNFDKSSQGDKLKDYSDDLNDDLPEWATEDPHEGGGSFDSTGAFHGSDDDLQIQHHIQKIYREEHHRDHNLDKENIGDDHHPDLGDKNNNAEPTNNKSDEIIIPPAIETTNEESTLLNQTTNSVDRMQKVADDMVEKLIMDDESNSSMSSLHVMQVVEDDLKKIIMTDDLTRSMPGMNDSKSAMQQNHDAIRRGPEPTKLLKQDENVIVSSQLSQMPPILPPPHIPPPVAVIGSDLWFYHDPQGNIQGPFTATEMAEWYRAGYFDENLYLRRQCDARFSSLGELVEMCSGAVPFLASHLLPPVGFPIVHPKVDPLPTQQQQQPDSSHNRHSPGNVTPTKLPGNMMDLNYLLQKQYLMRHQQQAAATNHLVQKMNMEPWNLLPPDQRNKMLEQIAVSQIATSYHPDPLLQQHQQRQKQQPQNMPPQLKSGGGVGKPQHFVQFDHSAAVPNDSIHQYLMSQPQLLQRSTSVPGQPQNDILVENDPINNLIMQLSIQKNGTDGVTNSLPSTSQDDDRTPSPWLDSSGGRLNPMMGGGGAGKMNMLQQVQQQSQNQKSHIISNMLINNMDLESQNLHQGPPQSNHPHDLQHSSWNNNGPIAASSVSNKNTSIWERLPDGGGNSMLHHQSAAKSMQQHIENKSSMSGGITDGQNVYASITNNTSIKNPESESYHHHQNNPTNLPAENHNMLTMSQEIEEANSELSKIDFSKFSSNKKEEKTKKSSELNASTPNNKKEYKKSTSNDDFIVEKSKKSKKDKSASNNMSSVTNNDDILINNAGATTTTTNNKNNNSKKVTNEKLSATGSNINQKNNNNSSERGQNSSNSITKSVAPWSFAATPAATSQSPSLAEIQKSEMERRAEQYRYEQILREQQQQTMIGLAKSNTNATFMWSGRNVLPKNIKSLAEIQAEEHAKQQEQYNNNNSGVQSSISISNQGGGSSGASNPLNYSRSNTSINLNNNKINKNDESGKVTFSALLNNNSWSAVPNSGASRNITTNNTTSTNNNNNSNSNHLSALGKFFLNYQSPQPQGIWEEQTTKKSKQNLSNSSTSSLLQSHQNMAQNHNQQSQQNKMILQKSQTVATMPQSTTKSLQNNSHNLIGAGGGGDGPGSGINHNIKNSYGNGQLNQGGHKSTIDNDITPSTKAMSSVQTKKDNNKKDLQVLGGGVGGGGSNSGSGGSGSNSNEFINWCIKTLSNLTNTVDVPTFATFLQDIESPYEVKDYIKGYLGESRECCEFAKQFLERRSKYKNQQRAQNAHIDDMCQPAPAINPGTNDFQEIKGKGKKVKKNKMTKLDSRILGFSVTAAQDRINVGDRDYGDAS